MKKRPATFHDIHGRMDGWTDGLTGEAILVGASWMRRNLNTAVATNLTYFILVTFFPYRTQFTAMTYSSKNLLR